MIILMQLVDATTWLQPQDHMEIDLWNKDKIYEYGEDEFRKIELNVKTLAKYGNYQVKDIDITDNEDGELCLYCTIWKD